MNDLAIKLDRVSKKYRLGQTGYRSLREDVKNDECRAQNAERRTQKGVVSGSVARRGGCRVLA